MTIQDLEEYRQIKNEVIQLNESLERLINNPNTLAFDTVKGSRLEKPYDERIMVIKGISPRYIATYEKRKKGLEKRISSLIDKIAEIEEFIQTVHRSEIRQIIELRYIRGFSWIKVSRRVYGSPQESRARMAIERFFKER